MTGVTRVAHQAVVICAALLLGGCAGGQAAPSAGASAASLATDGASPIARPLRNPDIDPGAPEILEPGTYILDRFPMDIAFDIPDGEPPGWHAGQAAADTAIVLWYTSPDITYGFALWNVDNVLVDPCDADAGELEPPVGPSVDDLVAAMSSLPGLAASAPVDVTIGAFKGKQIELTTLDFENCPQVTALNAADADLDPGLMNPLPGEAFSVQILDVEGVRIVLYRIEPAQRDAAVEAELQHILDSIRIEPLS